MILLNAITSPRAANPRTANTTNDLDFEILLNAVYLSDLPILNRSLVSVLKILYILKYTSNLIGNRYYVVIYTLVQR